MKYHEVSNNFLNSDQHEDIQKMNTTINKISDTDKEFLEEVSKAAADFSNNPREVKRFVNSLRFYRFFVSVLDSSEIPTFEQIGRWITLSLKWPQLVRWIYSNPEFIFNENNSPADNINFIQMRLKKLENLATGDSKKWNDEFVKLLVLNPNAQTPTWVYDNTIREFFSRETRKYGDSLLSSKAGTGVY